MSVNEMIRKPVWYCVLNMSSLQNRVAVITGGNSGIGLATAKLFVENGAQVVITGRRKEENDAAVAQIGSGVTAIVADTAKLKDIDQMMEQIRQQHGKIDILFLNAGIAPFASFVDVDEEIFDKVFDINVKGVFFTLQKALSLLNSGASVILSSSVLHKQGCPGAVVYAASKAAVRSIGQTVAAELVSQGVRVNILSPGPTLTPIFNKTGLSPQRLHEVEEKMTASVPLGRFGTPEEIANVALFLASDESSYFIGADLQADGGYSQSYS